MKSLFVNRKGLGKQLTMAALLLIVCNIIVMPSFAGMVTSAADAGPGTLRQEILDANADGVPTAITFDPSVFPESIKLVRRLPALLGEGDTINTGGLVVFINGEAVPETADNPAIGIRVMASYTAVVGLRLLNFANDAIYVGPSVSDSGAQIFQVTISDNMIVNNLDGIHVSGGAGPDNYVEVTIADNQLFANRDDGIVVEGSQGGSPGQNEVHVSIRGNTIWGSQGLSSGGSTTGDGIRVLGGKKNGSDNRIAAEIIDNRVMHNIDDGIVVAGAGGGAASNNTVEALIQGNTATSNGAETSTNGNGIVVRGGSRFGADPAGNDNSVLFELENNIGLRNKDTGIGVSGGLGSGNVVKGMVTANRARENGLDGLRVSNGMGVDNQLPNIVVSQNQLAKNGRDGIGITGGSGDFSTLENLLLNDNQSYLNGRFGISLNLGMGTDNRIHVTSIVGNRSTANIRDGLFIDQGLLGAGDTLIVDNRCTLNAEDGIDIESTGYQLAKNWAVFNLQDGISALGNTDGGGNIAVGNGDCNTPGCF